jgi:alkaline phosphatase D
MVGSIGILVILAILSITTPSRHTAQTFNLAPPVVSPSLRTPGIERRTISLVSSRKNLSAEFATTTVHFYNNQDSLVAVTPPNNVSPYGCNEKPWLGIYEVSEAPGHVRSRLWQYVACCGTPTYKPCSSAHINIEPIVVHSLALGNGLYYATLLSSVGYREIGNRVAFRVNIQFGATETRESISTTTHEHSCTLAHTPPAQSLHRMLPAKDTIGIRTLAFSSCFSPEHQEDNTFWQHVASKTNPDVWLWLGDNIYADGLSLETKRLSYNRLKTDPFYSVLFSSTRPPWVTATWDDHDYGLDNAGANYACKALSQVEFLMAFDIPRTDARFSSPTNPQHRVGVYQAHRTIPNKSSAHQDGIHIVNLDARSGRTPTFVDPEVACSSNGSRMMSETQWVWLEQQLSLESTLLVITSGVQVLPPRNQDRSKGVYCAYDHPGENGTSSFDAAIEVLGENDLTGTEFECWSEMPQERLRLLLLLQTAVLSGKTRTVLILSGDQHWGEVLAKELHVNLGVDEKAVLVHEVTASGIFRSHKAQITNDNRLRVRSADSKGNKLFVSECVFPFLYKGVKHTMCVAASSEFPLPLPQTNRTQAEARLWTTRNNGDLWCFTQLRANVQRTQEWGYCQDPSKELFRPEKYFQADISVPTTTSETPHVCSGSSFHECNAISRYGVVRLDTNQQTVSISLETPLESPDKPAFSYTFAIPKRRT